VLIVELFPLKPGIDCARVPREAMFVALPRKVDTMLPRAAERTMPRPNLACVKPNLCDSLSRGNGISVCCALSVETVLWRSGVSFAASINSRTRLPRFEQTNERVPRTNSCARQPRTIYTQRHRINARITMDQETVQISIWYMSGFCNKETELEKEFEAEKVDIAVILETKKNLKDHQ
jgi:hypothetical protein